MGAGKTTLGEEVARRLGRPFRDVDAELERDHGPIAEVFATRGKRRSASSRRSSSSTSAVAGAGVVAVGGGAVETAGLVEGLDALVVHLDVDVDTAWARVRGSERRWRGTKPTSDAGTSYRQPLYEAVADARARMPTASSSPRRDPPRITTSTATRSSRTRPLRSCTGSRRRSASRGEGGEDRRRRPSGSGGPCGSTATDGRRRRRWLDRPRRLRRRRYLRGVAWHAVPSTLVGQVDAAIGGKTAVDLPEGKNLVGAFHWPVQTTLDPALLETLPEEELRERPRRGRQDRPALGRAALGAPAEEQVRRCAAFQGGVCLRDPLDRGARAAQPRPHVRPRARGGVRLQARARRGGRARPARRAPAVRPRTRPARSSCCVRSARSTARPPGRRSRGTRSRRRRAPARLLARPSPAGRRRAPRTRSARPSTR